MQQANFFTPGYGDQVEQQNIERQRKMAELLQGQSMTPAEGQMVGNHFVAPSWTQHLAKVLGGYGSGMLQKQADERQLAMGKAMQDRNQADASSFMSAMTGTPAQPAIAAQPEAQGNNPSAYTPEQAAQPGQAEIPGDKNKAMAIALSSQNPMIQSMGSNMMNNQMQNDMMRQRLADALKSVGMGQPSSGASGTAATPGMPGQAGSSSGGGFGGVNGLAAALTMTGDPTLGKLGGMVQDVNKPMALREGDLVVPDGQGGYRSAYQQPKLEAGMVPVRSPSGAVTGAAALPGYAEGMAGIHGATAGAQEQAKAQNKTITVNTPQGPRLMTEAQAIAMAGGGQPSLPQGPLPPAQPGMTGSFSGPVEDVMRSINQIRDPQERSNAMSAYANQMTNNQPQGAGIPLQTEASKVFQTEQAKGMSTYSNALNDRVRQGADLNMRLQESVKAMQDFQTGGGKETRSQLAQMAQAVGAPDSVVNGIAGGDLGSMQEFKKLAVQQAMEQLKVAMGGAGRIAQAEFKVFQANNPNLDTDPNATKKVFDFSTHVFNRDMTEQKEFQQFQKQGNDPSDFPAYWSQRQTSLGFTNPGLNAQRDASPASKVGNFNFRSPSAPPADINALLKKYGG